MQADLNLPWALMSKGTFFDVMTHFNKRTCYIILLFICASNHPKYNSFNLRSATLIMNFIMN